MSSIQLIVTRTGPCLLPPLLASAARIQPERKLLLVRFTALANVAFTLLILSVVVGTRSQSLRSVIDPPRRLLPGSPLPNDAIPMQYGATRFFQIYQDGKEYGLTYDDQRHMITQTVSPMPEYTIGDLISAWGIPTGFAQRGPMIDVYWAVHSAHLMTCTFQPGSHIIFFADYLEEPRAAPWRGFTHSLTCSQKMYQEE